MQESSPLVQVEQVCKVYGDGAARSRSRPAVFALDNVSLTIAKGEFVAICGPSGSGKSTLLNLIGTLDKPTDGRIIINDVDVSTLKGNALADFRRHTIGFIFQLFNLVPSLTALENVMLPLIPYRRKAGFDVPERARELLAGLGLENRLHHLPSQLSGGEQQRVAIARALINHPQLILADEPTGNLDSQNGSEILALLQRLNQEQGVTLALITHDPGIAAQANRVVQLQDGKLPGEEV
ncbi:MAG: ABC transporter ATP-binding protein [Chloroflexi bacterium]|nr:ABC transporter ATP-binding protein [Chloroflexota bacterium]NOG37701.1 ABC transporter ATP-binding protein [Chloroflexota bacterium]GIK55233.1 MAG: macrolide ABC transporter ATP-binding protein [Chloroflexota bacterium]